MITPQHKSRPCSYYKVNPTSSNNADCVVYDEILSHDQRRDTEVIQVAENLAYERRMQLALKYS